MDVNSETWLADYLSSYDELLYKAYRDQTPGDQFAADCRELKQGMSSMQMVMIGIFEMMGTYKILQEDAERWGDTKACRQIAWELALEALQKLESEPIKRRLAN